ncbi:cytochrome b [Paraburkholderia strydomiana]|uniref:cytochrome b n=1 Tax=Paraburkholderia strydomiana TaxID=1245417 RepID=UPI001BE80E10|nr:cytochrome b [Paraburkholderia strydomiana]MBT2790116.1 cytochrome b [Paraburkholderia strydomiana]
MRPTAVSQTYSRPAVLLHWIIAALVALAYTAMLVRGPKGTDARVMWNTVHYCAGALVLTLAVLRVLWRLWNGAPPDIEASRALTFLARLAHLALYVFIFVQPLLGLLMLNSSGFPLVLPGIDLHIQLVGKDPLARKVIHDIHILIGNAFYWIIGLHALAALVHHLIFKDDTLRRMTGRTGTRPAQPGISK